MSDNPIYDKLAAVREGKYRERLFRDEISANFAAGNIGIVNGWLVEYHAPCPYPCAGVEYGCPPSCYMTPIVDLWSDYA